MKIRDENIAIVIRSAAVPLFKVGTLFWLAGCVTLVWGVGVFFDVAARPSRLREAAYHGDTESVRALLDLGTNVHSRDGWHSTALMYAAAEGHLEIVELLINHGAPVDERSRMRRTPLMWAARNGKRAIVRLRIDEGADAGLTDVDGQRAAELASEHGHSSITSYLAAATVE